MKMTRKELEQSYNAAQDEVVGLSWALHEALNKSVIWLKEGKIKAGIVRPTSASGGVVIIRRNDDKGFPRVYFLERWVDEVRKSLSPGDSKSPYYQQWLDEHQLANRVINMRNQYVEAENKSEMDRA